MDQESPVPIFRVYKDKIRDIPRPRTTHSVQHYYDYVLCSFTVGTYGEALPVQGTNLLALSRQLHEACKRNHLDIWIISANRGVLFFKIIAPQQREFDILNS